MGMIVLFALGIADHRVVARHRQSARTEHRIKINVRRAFEVIFCEQLSVNFNPELIFLLDDFDPVGLAVGC